MICAPEACGRLWRKSAYMGQDNYNIQYWYAQKLQETVEGILKNTYIILFTWLNIKQIYQLVLNDTNIMLWL